MKKLAVFVAFLVLLSGCGAPAAESENPAPADVSSEAVSSEISSSEASSAVSSDASSEVSSEASSEAASSEPAEVSSIAPPAPTPEEIAAAEQAAREAAEKAAAEQAAAQAAAAQAAAEQAAREAAEQAAAEQAAKEAAEQAAKEAAEKEAAEQKAAQKTTTKVSGMNFRSEVEKDLLALINEEREAEGLDPVKMDGDLQSAARIRSRELCKTGHWDHTRPNGDSWSTVLTEDVPVKFAAAGENLCMTEYDDPSVDNAYSADFYMDPWLNSPSHYDNIIRPNFTHVGIGVYVSERGGVTKGYATTIFAELP